MDTPLVAWDPSAALLEVLDPEQSATFRDHYLGVPFDLSEVLFVATANAVDRIPPALRDRLEILQLSGYSDTEKLQIATRHIVPKTLMASGLLPAYEVRFTPPALRILIRDYTHEAGLRELERQVANICRKLAHKVVEQESSLRPQQRSLSADSSAGHDPLVAQHRSAQGLQGVGPVLPTSCQRLVVTPQRIASMLGPPTTQRLSTEAVTAPPLIEVVPEPRPAALTVVCEGKTSQTRQDWGVEWDVTPYDQWALAARVQCEQPHAQVARQWFNQGEILAFLPLGGAAGNLCALVWSVSPARAKDLQAASEEDFCHCDAFIEPENVVFRQKKAS